MPPVPSSTEKLSNIIFQTLDDKKATEIVTVDLAGKSALADQLIIATGISQRHLQALEGYLEEALGKESIKPLGVEGVNNSDWIVLDLGDIIVHLLTSDARSLYNLEKIWNFPLKPREEAVDLDVDAAHGD